MYGPRAAEAYAVKNGKGLAALCVITFQQEKGIKGPFSRRAIIYGGPLLCEGEEAACRELLSGIDEVLRRRAIYAEVRNFKDYRFLTPVYQQAGWEYLPYLDLQLPIEGKTAEEILAGMKYNRRREIRLSLENNAFCRPAETEAEASALYQILKNLYHKRVRVPLPEYRFFQQLYFSDIGKVLVVLHRGAVVGGVFCFFLEGRGIYTMYYCGIRNYHPRIFPTHLAVLGAIEFGLQNGLKRASLMGAGRRDEQYGVRRYKMGFGGELVEPGRFLKILNPLLFKVGKLGLALMQKTAVK